MPTPPQILWGFILPALIAAALAIIGSRMPRGSTWGSIIGFAIGFVLAYHTFKGNWPPLKPVDADGRTALLTIATAILAIVIGFKRVPKIVYVLLLIAAPISLTAFILLSLPASSQPAPAWEWISGISLAIIITAALIELLAHQSGPVAAALTLGPLAAGVGLVLMMSGSATAGEIAAAAAMMILGWFIASFTHKTFSLAHGPVLVAILPVAGLLMYPSLPPSTITPLEIAILLAAAPLAWIVEIPPISRAKPWKRELLRIALVAIPVLVAVGLAHRQFVIDSANKAMEM